jgi:hypothetical protein
LKLTDGLWVRRMTLKDNIGMSLYMLIYGKEKKMPIILKLNALIFVVNIEDAEDISPMQKRVKESLKLEEEPSKSLNITS